MKITLAQIPLHWESPTKNIEQVDEMIKGLQTDLLILPEMFTTGFTMQPEQHAESEGLMATQAMQRWAQQIKGAVMGSIAVASNQRYYNRLFFVTENGVTHTYDKRHLFRMGHEEKHYSSGNHLTTIPFLGWNIRPLICYDLRFPVWSRNKFHADPNGTYTAEYDVLVYVANWPAVRAYPWRQLLIARAIENQCYVIGVNRVGEDGHGVAHSGNSMIIDPLGQVVAEVPAHQSLLSSHELALKILEDCRAKFKVGLDADPFHLDE